MLHRDLHINWIETPTSHFKLMFFLIQVKIVQHLHNEDKIFANENSKPTVNVMSQYNAQCNAVTAALKKEKLEKYVDVHTVVSSQGML